MPVKIINPRRFVVTEFDPQRMIRIGNFAISTIFYRLNRAETVNDTPAPPLIKAYRKDGQEHGSRSYPLRKVKRWGAKPIRDLLRTGRMRSATQVVQAGYNYCVLGFADPKMAWRMRWNQKRSRQWGLSPKDMRELVKYIFDVSKTSSKIVRTERVA